MSNASTATQSIDKLATELAEAIEDDFQSIDVKVLIMGPSASPDAENSAGAKLRIDLARRCREFGTSVFPEHPTLVTAAAKLGEDHDLCTYEHHLVRQCQLLIVLPASPGSFCELGFFGMRNEACTKMLILFDQKKPASGTYVADGPVRAAKNRRALVEYVNYDAFDDVWELVRRQIVNVRARMSIRE